MLHICTSENILAKYATARRQESTYPGTEVYIIIVERGGNSPFLPDSLVAEPGYHVCFSDETLLGHYVVLRLPTHKCVIANPQTS